MLNIVLAQANFLVGDLKGNAQRIIDLSQQAIEQYHADLVVFPELALSGYPPEDLLLRPGFYKRAHQALEQIQDAKLSTTLIVGYPDKIGTKYFNKAAIISQGEMTQTYSKQCLPNYTVFDEKRYFSTGDRPCVITVKQMKIGILICEDLWLPEPIQRTLEADAEMIISINASPFDRNKAKARESLLKKHATEGNVPILYVNLIGGQDELVFDGGSMVVSASGERVQQGAYYAEDLLHVEVERNTHPHIIPKALPPRLSNEENIYKALTLGVKDYIEKNNFPGAIIGLSGGIDSALTCAIAVDAIGADRVHGVLMPSRFTHEISIEDALAEAKALNVKTQTISIEPLFEAFLSSIAPSFKGLKQDTTEENIQARIRGMLLMALSNKFGSIVLTTGNKSEMSVGYATLYGDMAGGFAVLKDVPKTLVYRLAQYRNLISPVIPERVITRPPSAELAPDQQDQDSLPPYSILDEILHGYIEEDQDPTTMYSERLDKDVVNKVVTMINQNEYKRRQAPIGIITTVRGFGKARRYPITSGYTKNLEPLNQ